MQDFKSNYQGWPTTRCYPRTMAEAFPKDPENYIWFHKHEKQRSWTDAVVWCAGFMMWIALAYWYANT